LGVQRSGAERAVFWDRVREGYYREAVDLGTLGGARSKATAINDLGDVVGTSLVASGAERAFIWSSASAGPMTDLGLLPGADNCEANDINDRGQVVGSCSVPLENGSHISRAVLWSDGTVISLDARHSRTDHSVARGINDRGEVYGTTGRRLVLWIGDERVPVGTTSTSSLGDVNDRSEVVGNEANTAYEGDGRLFTTNLNGYYEQTTLGALPGGASSAAFDINERGEVVGVSQTENALHGFVWDRGTMTDIGTLGGPNSSAIGINDRGEVVGQSHLADEQWRAFLWSRAR